MIPVTALVVAYGAEPWLEDAVTALLGSTGVTVDVVLVDNGCTDGAVDRLEGRSGVTVLRPGANLGFAGGCQLAAESAGGEVLALVNPDAIVEPDALTHLAEAAMRAGVGIATASVRLADRPDLLNSAGNEIHFLGVSWSGSFEEPAAAHDREREALAASGAAMAVRREVWRRLGGMASEYFAYYEDAELSLRCWQQGLAVVYVPRAVVRHRYEFSRNAMKLELVERNRLLMVLTCYEARTLALLAPLLVALEVAVLALAVAQGWVGPKVAGWRWIVGHRRWVAQRRRLLQRMRTVPDRELAIRFATTLDPGNFPLPRPLLPLNRALRAWWWVARRLL